MSDSVLADVMTRIVTTHYRYKPPPRKRKAAPLAGPAVVTAKSSRRPVLGKTAAEVLNAPVLGRSGAMQPSTPREAARIIAAPPTNDDRRPAIATTASKKRRISDDPPLPMELPLSRKPVERDGGDYKRLKAAMARRLRGADE
jgi:hypothetical protein